MDLKETQAIMDRAVEYLVPVKDGYLSVIRCSDPDYPGVYVGFCKTPGGAIQEIALVETNEDYPNQIRAHLWEDSKSDSATHDASISINKED